MVDKREVLVQTAMRLFAQGGYTGIGIDRIIAEAGIAKMTLYKYFPSKQDLILEVLTQRDVFFRTSLMNYVDQQEGLAQQILALFTWHDQWFKRKDFNGCMFINAAAEFHERKNPIHQISALHKKLIIDYIESLLKETHGARSAKLASQINILLDGAIDAAHLSGNPDAAMQAWEVAQYLVERPA
ncbi:TetR/AcrR family transcriptional regulator [Herminiimonas glaciei]|uniref:TetR/AcrR family transcriptional regulator n=1 Tax=Herminiimonas glaciei TaxID=523788 RepID=A0ABW2IDP6_9BURK